MFSNNLKKARKNCKMSQESVAEQLNIARSNISKYESGDLEPNIDTLKKLCQIYKVSADELLEIKYIKTAHMAARSFDNEPSKTITGDFTDVLNAPPSKKKF